VDRYEAKRKTHRIWVDDHPEKKMWFLRTKNKKITFLRGILGTFVRWKVVHQSSSHCRTLFTA